ncbi:hypothetical protein AID11_07295 [Salmonella enterica subsp. enterica]|nr:hypothetical protein [Salmonella enterica subsp. enterica serovar Poona]
MSAALIGFVLLVNPCGYDACEWEPVTEKVYPDQSECQRVAEELRARRPYYEFSCGEVHRGEEE